MTETIGKPKNRAGRKPQDFKTRFWSKVDIRADNDCWEWIAGKHDFGYGQFWVNELGMNIGAHVVSYKIHFGEVPSGLCVCHQCDNPKCVNPNHLFLATQKENNLDRDKKGRHKSGYGRQNRKHGELHPNSKLTHKQVSDIRSEYKKGVRGFGIPALAKKYGVLPFTIYSIVNHLTWV